MGFNVDLPHSFKFSPGNVTEKEEQLEKYLVRLSDAVEENMRRLSNKIGDAIYLTIDGTIYIGDPNVNGSWRLIRSGNDYSRQRRESGVWVEKAADTP